MMYRDIECPVCGNTTEAKSIREPQKCTWCKRYYKVDIVKRNKEGKKVKFDWFAEPTDLPTVTAKKSKRKNKK